MESSNELIGGKYTRAEIQEFYKTDLTDKQWALLVKYSSSPTAEETTEFLIVDFMSKIDLMEDFSDEYARVYKEMWGEEPQS